MHHEDIKAAVRKRGVSPSDLATHLGVSAQCISGVIRGRVKSRRVANAIAKITGASVHELWPNLYDEPKKTDLAAMLRGVSK